MTDPLTMHAVAVLARGHGLFAGEATVVRVDNTQQHGEVRTDGLPGAAAQRSTNMRNDLHRSTDTDRTLARIMAMAHKDHAQAKAATRAVLEDALADTTTADTPMARREAMARMAARLRAQHRHRELAPAGANPGAASAAAALPAEADGDARRPRQRAGGGCGGDP